MKLEFIGFSREKIKVGNLKRATDKKSRNSQNQVRLQEAEVKRARLPSSTRSSQNLANEVICIGSVLIRHDTGCTALGRCSSFLFRPFEIDKKNLHLPFLAN